MPSLNEPYILTTLPRISDLDPLSTCIVADISSSDTQIIDLGISRSTIASYILRPSPKLIWSYSLSPSTIVDSMSVYTDLSTSFPSQTNNYLVNKKFVIGVTDRKKFKLYLISTLSEEENAVEETSSDKCKVAQIEVKSKTNGIKMSSTGEYFTIIQSNGDLRVYAFDTSNEKPDSIWEIKNKSSNAKVVHHEFIEASDISNYTHGSNLKDTFAIIIEKVGKKQTIKFFSIGKENGLELTSVAIDSEESIFTYNAGVLYRFIISSQKVQSYSLPNFKLINELSLNDIFKNKTKTSYTLLSPAPGRLLLSDSTKSLLINVKFSSILDTLMVEDEKKLYLLNLARVNGNSMKTINTFAIGLINEDSNNSLNIINFDVGLGNLSESLGKSISSYSSKTADLEFNGLPNLIDSSFTETNENNIIELNEVYQKLSNFKKAKNLVGFEFLSVNYLKNEPWSNLKNVKSEKLKEFQVFESEKDKIIDSNFVQKVVELIFGGLSDIGLNDEFIPEYTLTYLFTHPLFPVQYTEGLLARLHKYPRLLRQAIVTCPNLPYEDIIFELTNENNEIFNDVLVRLTEEFSVSKITSSAINIIKSHIDFNLGKILTKCLSNDNGWFIVSSLIDAGGLFSLSDNLISNLLIDVEEQIKSLSLASYNLGLANQSLIFNEVIHDQELKKSRKKFGNTLNSTSVDNASTANGTSKQNGSASTKSNPIIEVNPSSKQLDSILNINGHSKRNFLEDGAEISKKISLYSIEKLVL